MQGRRLGDRDDTLAYRKNVSGLITEEKQPFLNLVVYAFCIFGRLGEGIRVNDWGEERSLIFVGYFLEVA